MTKRVGWIIWSVIAAVAIISSIATYRRFPFPETGQVQVPVPVDSLNRFAQCMGWSASTRRKAEATTIYSGPAPDLFHRYAGVQKDGWLWVRDEADFYPVLYHEWTHVAVPNDPRHRGPAWLKAQDCGASLSWLDLLPVIGH